jgi:uncharacterized protein YfaS (alpha-2-macroglobulin family)
MKLLKPAMLFAFIFAAIVFFTANNPPMNKDFDEKWKQVDSLTNLRQPRSALEIVDEIYRLAKAQNNSPQLIKANLFRLRLMSEFEEDHLVKAIRQLHKELETAVFPEKELLHSIVGDLYMRYFQMNRYQILQRSRLLGFDGEDIQTWDAHKLLTTASEHFQYSLMPAEELQKVDLKIFSAILDEKKDSKLFRPTLFDFLAHRAIDFYTSAESGITVAADQYKPDRAVFFAPAEQFVTIAIEAERENTNTAKALMIYMELLRFHLNDNDPQALIDADLKRLGYIHSTTIVEDADSLYLGALNHLKEQYSASEHSASISFELAKFHNLQAAKYNPLVGEDYQWERKKAVEICEEAINKFPRSASAENCRIVLEQITQPSINIKTEHASIPARPSLGLLEWKNHSKVFFRLIKMESREFKQLTWRTGASEIARQLLLKSPEMAWQIDVPNEMDFQQHATEFKIPGLKEGFYVLLASGGKDFSGDDHEIVWADFRVTNLTFISQRLEGGGHEFFVLDREKGAPLNDVTVRAFTRDYDFRTREHTENLFKVFTTNKEGYFTIEPENATRNISLTLEFLNNADQYYPGNTFHLGVARTREPRPELKSFFFTDRAIYRPGQTVYFKSIILEKTGEKHEIVTDHATTVEFFDVNFQMISSQSLVTNEYGSVNGSFVIPTGMLNGQMTLRNGSGSVSFRVEDYKRPTFAVAFEPVSGSYKLGEDVTLEGSAEGYAGNMIDGANLIYRVVRKSTFPYRGLFYSGFFPQQTEMEIASGETITDENGNFSITFNAIPDQSLKRSFRPVFRYTVYASVTDINGETQAGEQTVSVGYDALFLNVDIPEKLDRSAKPSFKLEAVNFNGQKQDTEVQVEIFKLKDPEQLKVDRLWNRPDIFVIENENFKSDFPGRIYDDELNYEFWEKEQQIYSRILNTKANSLLEPEDLDGWKSGKYVVQLSATDLFGNEVKTVKYFTLFSPTEKRPPITAYNWFVPLKSSGEPGEEAAFLLGTSARNVNALYEIQHKGKVVHREWIKLGRDQREIKVPIKEAYRGNFSVQVNFVIDGREYNNSMIIKVPFTNKQLDIAFETFRSQLEPGSSEEWKIVIKDKKGDRVAAQMLASMYDASLDAFVGHGWTFDLYHQHNQITPWQSFNSFSVARSGRWNFGITQFKPFIMQEYDRLNWFGFDRFAQDYFLGGGIKARASATMDESLQLDQGIVEVADQIMAAEEQITEPPDIETPAESDIFEGMNIRRDFKETAFFYPELKTNEKGEVIIRFTLPESFTKWKFMGMGYTKDLMTGMLEEEFTASKNLMLMPNAPRFFRMGDTLWFTARISNLTDEDIEGTAQLEFFDPVTMRQINAELQLDQPETGFEVMGKRSVSLRWKIIIPESYGVMSYRIKAAAGSHTDGEEKMIPVLPNRMLVTESLPMPVRGEETRTFSFDRLIASNQSETLRHHKLTLEFSSNPAWYAVQALPVISEPTHKNSLSIFAAVYANSIAFNIANSNPKIKRVFDTWKTQTPEAFLSNLEKNQALKTLLLEQTPWVLQANNETERKQRIALLFDINNMQHRLDGAIRMLQQMQTPNGGFRWFEGMRDSRYITQQIVQGFGKLHSMGIVDAQNDQRISQMLNQAVRYLEERIREDYEEILRVRKDQIEKDNLSALHIQFLYARSFFDFIKLNPNSETALNYFRHQSEKFWQKQNNYLQGMIALALSRYGNDEVPPLILKSLKERSLTDDEMGMYWKSDPGFYWYQAPVETQAMMIEAFAEIANDMESVEMMKVWLLKQKQTQAWNTGRATVEAVTALFAKGTDLLGSDEQVEIVMAGELLNISEMTEIEAGTGYFQISWDKGEISSEMGNISVSKTDKGIAWGAVYWQYFEDLDKITPHDTPLSVKKKLFVERITSSGIVIEEISQNDILKIGDKITVRIELRVDRDMEYVHMKDMRASAFEPVNVLSGYRFKGGLGYYESTRDAATNFFFDYLRKGTYVFEYPLIASQTGNFSNGISTIQCMYAPEFSSHSEGIRVKVE